MNDAITVVKRGHILAGIATIILGVVVLVWPSATLLTLAILLGLQLVIWGGVSIVTSFMLGSGSTMVFGILGGVLSVVLGIATFRYPGRTVALLAIVVGAAWFVGGIFDFFQSFRGPGTRWGILVYAILSIVAGLIMMIAPIESASTLAWVAGVMFIALGIARIFSATQLSNEFEQVTVSG